MKNALLAGALILAAGGIILLGGDPPGICPEKCPGKHCQVAGDYCVMVTATGEAKRINDKAEEISSISTLPSEKQIRPLMCCVTDEDGEHMTVRWASQVTPECTQITVPTLFPGIEMNCVDLGHAKLLNFVCCKRVDGPVSPGHWGQCPYCAYECKNGKAVLNQKGCEEFCKEPEVEEEVMGPHGEWLPTGPHPVPSING